MPISLEPRRLPEETSGLRRDVRRFLDEAGRSWTLADRCRSWTAFDRDFSMRVGAQGWIGMTWPKRYGGAERSVLERYVVIEEMLAAGAPVGAHWVADRQSGPLILRVGTEEQKQAFLPRIVRGELAFCIGLSEPDSGSDLASVRARASRVDGGWRLNGAKIWTTNAHKSDYMIALFRSSPTSEGQRHSGLSQFIIDMRAPGLEVRPICDLTGEGHFNECRFDDVFVPDTGLIGNEGDGWAQVNAELAFERSGPDRYLSAFPLVAAAMDAARSKGSGASTHDAREIGSMMAGLASVRAMSVAVAALLEEGEVPHQEAALVKDLGLTLEQDAMRFTEEIVGALPHWHPDGGMDDALAYLTQVAPTFSLRGGTREIMRGVIARGIGVR